MVLYLTEDILNESVGGQQVSNALTNRQAVIINYADEKASHTGKRYIEPYLYGITIGGNPAIRAYQYYGDSKTGTPSWKVFRLDRISSWEPTQNTFQLEPQARGWAAEAFNKGGDKLFSQIYQIVNLEETPQTEYEKLKAKTNSLIRNKPINIEQFKDKLQYPEERNKQLVQQTQNQQQKQSGPINSPENQPSLQTPSPKKPERNDANPVQNNGENGDERPINQQPNQSGPITGNATNPEENKPQDLMSNDEFKKMLQRNLDITDKEKANRFGK